MLLIQQYFSLNKCIFVVIDLLLILKTITYTWKYHGPLLAKISSGDKINNSRFTVYKLANSLQNSTIPGAWYSESRCGRVLTSATAGSTGAVTAKGLKPCGYVCGPPPTSSEPPSLRTITLSSIYQLRDIPTNLNNTRGIYNRYLKSSA